MEQYYMIMKGFYLYLKIGKYIMCQLMITTFSIRKKKKKTNCNKYLISFPFKRMCMYLKY